MNYWLIKSEPGEYSWQKLVQDKQMYWYGVRNYAARNNLKSMQVGDLCLFYHSNVGKEIVGIATVVKEFYQDPTTTDTTWVVVDVAPKVELKIPVSLATIKSNPNLVGMELVRLSRLSVSKVSKSEFDLILELSQTHVD